MPLGNVTIRDAHGAAISQSQNLRGIHEHCSRVAATTVSIVEQPDSSAQVDITWADGSHVAMCWLSYRLARDWSRTSRFEGASVTLKSR